MNGSVALPPARSRALLAFEAAIIIALVVSLLVLAPAGIQMLRSEPCSLTVHVAAPGQAGELRLSVNEELRRVQMRDEATEVFGCALRGKPLTVRARLGELGAYDELVANGSGFIDLILEQRSGGDSQWGVVRQKPAITFQSADKEKRLDVYRNGASEGTTAFTKGVPAGEQQQYVWKRSDRSVACGKTATLDWDQTRVFTCDPGSGRVAEE